MRKRFKKKFYRLNYNIFAPRLRVVDEYGKQIGILTREEALRLSQQKELDLVEVAPQASPPVCKLIDFRKFLYQQKKREKKKKKGKKERKEIRLRPFISDYDYKTRLDQARKFLKEGNSLRIRILFFGREIERKESGLRVVRQLLKDLEEVSTVEKGPEFLGNSLIASLIPKKDYAKEKKDKTKG